MATAPERKVFTLKSRERDLVRIFEDMRAFGMSLIANRIHDMNKDMMTGERIWRRSRKMNAMDLKTAWHSHL